MMKVDMVNPLKRRKPHMQSTFISKSQAKKKAKSGQHAGGPVDQGK